MKIKLHIILKIILGILVVIGVAAGYVFQKIYAENLSPVTAINPQSSMPKALVIYDPGLSDFQERVTKAFADGLTAKWHVELTTSSKQTPIDLGSYSLIVLGGPVYGGIPSKPVQDYLDRVGSFESLKVVVLITAAGAGEDAEVWMKEKIEAMGGEVVESIVLSTMTPNEDRYGIKDPIEIAFKEAESIDYMGN